MPLKPSIILAGLTERDALSVMHKNPGLFLWDSYRNRVEALDKLDENDLVMTIYQLMFEQEGRAKWMGGILSYSWIDAALFLEERHPSYVDNFASIFRKRFFAWGHYGFYESDTDCLRLNRVLPGIPTYPKTDLCDVMKKMIAPEHT